ncbi:hypothetical protein LSCM1_01432 [Leishmania martiniquensis]|uniref:Uncharacterized protein n=1 Tax=Leishmania martiniquensis TaxID=1580590 RepID=A0A836GX26_9TRYP|nr:hypothetical protein LSCM1_01432 [Leishmania martiniquensis]
MYSGSAPQRQTCASTADTTLPKVDAGAAEQTSYTLVGTSGGPSASSTDRVLVPLSPAPSKTAGAGAAPSANATGTPSADKGGRVQALLARARVALAKTSVARESCQTDARVSSGDRAPPSVNAHDLRKGLPVPLSQAVKSHRHSNRHCCKEADEEKCSSRSSTSQRNISQKSSLTADPRADHLTLPLDASQLRGEKLSGSAAGSAESGRRVSAADTPFGRSSSRAFARGRAADTIPAAVASAVDASHSAEKSSSSPSAALRGSCERQPRPSLSITPGYPKASNAAAPSVRFIYTRSSRSCKARSPEKAQSFLVSAAKDVRSVSDRVAAALMESATAAAGVVSLTDEDADAPTTVAPAHRSLGAPPPPSCSTLPHQNEYGHHHQSRMGVPLARLTNADAPDMESQPAAPVSLEGRKGSTGKKCGDRPGKHLERTAHSSFHLASTRDFEEAPQSYLKRWRQRQEAKSLKGKTAEPISASASPDIESCATYSGLVTKGAASAAAKEGEEPSSRAATATAFGLAVGPRPHAKEPVRPLGPISMEDAKSATTLPNPSHSSPLSEVMHGTLVAQALEATLASVGCQRSSKEPGATQPKTPSATHSQTATGGAAVAEVRSDASLPCSATSVSAHPSFHSSSSSCCLTLDAAHDAAVGERIPVGRVMQSWPPLHDSPIGAIVVKSPRPSSSQPATSPGLASEAAEGTDSTSRRPPGCAFTHRPARREAVGGPAGAEKESAAPFLLGSAAETRKRFRAALERRGQRLQLQESVRSAGHVSRQPTSTEAWASMPDEGAAVPLDSYGPGQISGRRTTDISTPCSSPWKVTQGSALVFSSRVESMHSSACADRTVTPEGLSTLHLSTVASPPTEPGTDEDAPSIGERAAAETRVEPAFSADGRGRDCWSSFRITETASGKASPVLQSPQHSTDEELVGHRTASRTSGAYTSLLQWIRQNRTPSPRPAAGVPETILAVDATVRPAAVSATTETKPSAHLAERRALVDKYRRPSRNVSDAEVPNNEALQPEAGASGQAFKASLAHKSTDAWGSQRHSSSTSSMCISSLDKDKMPEKQLSLAPEHLSGQDVAEGSSLPVTSAGLPSPALSSAVTSKVKGSAATSSTLGGIGVDELDKLEQSVNALLKNYRHGKAIENGGAPSKLTAAAALMLEMPPPTQKLPGGDAKRTDATLALSADAMRDPKHGMPARGNAGEKAHVRVRHDYRSETEDEDSEWGSSGLWCGEEALHEAKPPPAFVPPLDFTLLLLPTGDSEELTRYRIPMPSAVPAPD